ncbi:MAG: XdhC family protein [Woeseiaceae bacterium]
MTASSLIGAFKDWSAEGRPLVLATVFETAGSTYSKCGAQMLITDDGRFQGMLSGGCLEGDLAERARTVLRSGNAQTVVYDLGKNDDELWGLGVGCDGLMKIFLQPLRPETAYEPFAAMAGVFSGDRMQLAATVIKSSIAHLRVGATQVTADEDAGFSDLPVSVTEEIGLLGDEFLATGDSGCRRISDTSGAAKILFTVLKPPPALLVLGAGLDAEPLVRFAHELGWKVTLQDHRPAYLDAGNFSGAETLHCVPVDELSDVINFDQFAAVIIMSHHLVSDRQYLRQIADSDIAYVGLLGPVDRRRRLLEELGAQAEKLEARLHGPAGIDIGGRGPASIALSIVAEIHLNIFRPETGA